MREGLYRRERGEGGVRVLDGGGGGGVRVLDWE